MHHSLLEHNKLTNKYYYETADNNTTGKLLKTAPNMILYLKKITKSIIFKEKVVKYINKYL